MKGASDKDSRRPKVEHNVRVSVHPWLPDMIMTQDEYKKWKANRSNFWNMCFPIIIIGLPALLLIGYLIWWGLNL